MVSQLEFATEEISHTVSMAAYKTYDLPVYSDSIFEFPILDNNCFGDSGDTVGMVRITRYI